MAELSRAKTFDAQGPPHLVAVMRVLAHLAEDDDFILMLVDEAKIASVLRHGNIARVYEFARAHGEYFIAMEHVDGKDMRTVLERCRAKKKPIPHAHAAYIAAEVGAALHAAHSAVDSRGRQLRLILEEYVMADDVSEDVGESMMQRDDDFEPPEVPFQPKPTSVSIAAIGTGTNGGDSRVTDFSSDSNFTTMPKVDAQDIHGANTVILEDRGRRAPPRPPPPGRRVARTQPPPPPPAATTSRLAPDIDEAKHAAPTMLN